jgi:hypothetical protein
MSLNLFQDLFIRMFVIVGVFDFFIWWLIKKGVSSMTLISLFILEMAVITISLWFDVIYRKKNLKR